MRELTKVVGEWREAGGNQVLLGHKCEMPMKPPRGSVKLGDRWGLSEPRWAAVRAAERFAIF